MVRSFQPLPALLAVQSSKSYQSSKPTTLTKTAPLLPRPKSHRNITLKSPGPAAALDARSQLETAGFYAVVQYRPPPQPGHEKGQYFVKVDSVPRGVSVQQILDHIDVAIRPSSSDADVEVEAAE